MIALARYHGQGRKNLAEHNSAGYNRQWNMSRSSIPCPQPEVVELSKLAPRGERNAEDAAEAWLRGQDAIVDGLLRELDDAREAAARAMDRVRRIEDTLGRVRAAAGPRAPVLDADDAIDMANATVAEAIWFAVASHERGMTAAEIQAWAKGRGRVITTKFLHTYVHRMLQDGRLRAEGERGNRKYFVGRPIDRRSTLMSGAIVVHSGQNSIRSL